MLQALFEKFKGSLEKPIPFKVFGLSKNNDFSFLDEQKSYWTSLAEFFKTPLKSGFYCVGPVGRGKTFLLEKAFESLNTAKKEKWHYYGFMFEAHQLLASLRKKPNPYRLLVKIFKERFDVLFLDEFQVTEIADAMILKRLLSEMHTQGIRVVLTTNTRPQDLYKNGLNRDRFEPCINYLLENFEVVTLETGRDLRRQKTSQRQLFFLTLTGQTQFESLYKKLCENEIPNRYNFSYHGHSWRLECTSKTAKFKAKELFIEARGAIDYSFLADTFEGVFISHLLPWDDRHLDEVRRFMTLVDIFYDQRRFLVLSSSVSLEELYTGKALPFERTLSRLMEMMHWDIGQ